jgi:xanthine phosphoribosyltransferase
MELLKEKIRKDGVVKPGNVLKVDNFLNHQIDVALLDEIAKELKRRFGDAPITKVLTIETSGIAIACAVAREYGVPVVFAKKSKSVNMDGEVYVAEVESYTHKKTNQVIVAKKFLNENDHVLIVDDFLANGCALQGLISIVDGAGAEVVGCGIVIEKGFQEGGHRIRNLGFHLESLAIVDSMDDQTGEIVFRTQE